MTMPAAYSAIKGGVISLSKYLASYYGGHNIRVNTVSPGGIFNNQPESFVDRYCKKVPLNRMGAPEDVAPTVVFLLSDKASYISGQNIVVDGGLSIL
jgi:NAD(P)-dependent dehydrogenase (short-subunit alcohol dehydrogenase family)